LKKNIVFLINTLQTGGAEKSLLEITQHFKRYHPVFVQLFDKGSDLKPEFEAVGIPIINLGLRQSYRFKQISKAVWQHIQPLNPVLIHATLYISDMVSRRLPLKGNIPLINSFVNNSYGNQRYRSEPFSIKIKLWLLQQWDALTTEKVNLFISNSEAIKITNARALRLNPEKIKVIYRGRSLAPFEKVTLAELGAFRSEFDLTRKRVFLNVGRLIERKGQLDLIRAFSQVCKQRSDCVLLIAGEGPFRKILSDEIDKLSLARYVRLLGSRNDVPLLLKLADVFVFPSYHEGLPGSVIEAMFARTPVIASAIPENLECVDDSMALFHEVGDLKDLAEQMLKALDDQHWKERTDKAFDYAMEHFEISKVAEQYEKLYDQLLETKSKKQYFNEV